jgi:hypothetical protein
MPKGSIKKINNNQETDQNKENYSSDLNQKQDNTNNTDNPGLPLSEKDSNSDQAESKPPSSTSSGKHGKGEGENSSISTDSVKKLTEIAAIDHRSELEILMEDVRESLKENTLMDSTSQVLPGSAYQKKKDLPKPLQVIDNWFSDNFRNPYYGIGANKKLSTISIILIICAIALLVTFLIIIGRNYVQTAPTNIPTNTPIPTFAIPQPFSIEFPGGWIFLLEASQDVYPDWKPIKPEWLKGTEICKLIALPWNIQIDAVYKTIIKGDIITITMDNKDQYPYKVATLEMVSKDKLIQRVNSNSPCMIIFLYNENNTIWQVISTLPSAP